MANSVPRGVSGIPIAALIGTLGIAEASAIYVWLQGAMSFSTPVLDAQAYLVALLACVMLIVGDGYRFMERRIASVRMQGFAPLSPSWLLPYVLSQRRYRAYFVLSTVLYGVFYAFVTSMIVYQPGVDFVQAYQATFPSALVAPCCGGPLSTPVVTVYLANHLGLLLIPLTMILLVLVSALVGLNFALAAFAFGSRVRGASGGWVAGLGAVVGLFTGCPTCAGLFFANSLGGAGAVSMATVLASYQPVFILASLPVLALTPYLISRSLLRVYRQGCVYLPEGAPR